MSGASAAAGPVVVLGRGRVGRSLADAWSAAGVAVELRSAREDASFAAGFADDALVVLAVPDAAIGPTAERVRGAVGGGSVGSPLACDTPGGTGSTTHQIPTTERGSQGPGPAVVHLSGASGFGPLESLREAGLPVGIAHPFAPFPEPRPPALLRGVTFGVAASDPALLGRLRALVSAIGGAPQAVAADGWVAYHLAGAIASNYLVVLAAQAAALLERAGFDADGARDALLPLMQGTLDNLASEGVDNALSGPLRRGDVGTVERHLNWLDRRDPSIAAVYRALARPGIDLAVGTGLDDAAAEALRRVVG